MLNEFAIATSTISAPPSAKRPRGCAVAPALISIG